MPAITGWFDRELALRGSLAPRLSHDQAANSTIIEGSAFWIQLNSSCCTVHISDDTVTVISGTPRDGEMRTMTATDVALLLRTSCANNPEPDWNQLRGRFAGVHIDLRRSAVTLVTDRFGVFPLCYSIALSRIAFSDRADSVPLQGPRELYPQAIYNYVYFHVIPAPRTIFRGVQRIEPATRLRLDAAGLHAKSTWQPVFIAKPNFDIKAESERFRVVLQQAVKREATTARMGAFLSGGTDSSTVVGLLSLMSGEPVQSFSIGFEASGYDEISYARLAAQHFKSELHEHYITPAELVRAIPLVAGHYDQPFGNSSALPAYYCARLAREHGIEKLLAGDGGDELFGGNTRYARQKIFNIYQVVPAMMRQRMETMVDSRSARSVPGLRKIVRYVEQARLPMPERMESYNLLDHFGDSSVFTSAFLHAVNISEPRKLQREIYQRSAARSIVDRMLVYDWRFTLADSDLPKVRCTTHLAGAAVGFPFLDDDLVDFSLSLPASMKVRRLRLRHFFKTALSDFLPVETIRKKKHGFGLPFGPWLMRDQELFRFASEALEQLTERGFIRRELVHDLLSTRLNEHSGFYGEMVWILMMLEHWLKRHAPTFKLD
jgi:asparagine synthase (glutamine-hydrolysing)